jgi:hypothetical protein
MRVAYGLAMGNGRWRPGGVVGLGISVEDPDVGAVFDVNG